MKAKQRLIASLRVTKHQCHLMMALGLDSSLGVDFGSASKDCTLSITAKDCDAILGVVQSRGRTGMSLRRRVIAVKLKLEREPALAKDGGRK